MTQRISSHLQLVCYHMRDHLNGIDPLELARVFARLEGEEGGEKGFSNKTRTHTHRTQKQTNKQRARFLAPGERTYLEFDLLASLCGLQVLPVS